MGPVEFAHKTIVGNLHSIDGAWIGLQLVGVGPEPIEEEAIFRFVSVVVEPDMPLIRVMGQAEWKSRCLGNNKILENNRLRKKRVQNELS